MKKRLMSEAWEAGQQAKECSTGCAHDNDDACQAGQKTAKQRSDGHAFDITSWFTRGGNEGKHEEAVDTSDWGESSDEEKQEIKEKFNEIDPSLDVGD